MFTTLHALAKQATLMITVAAEGDDQLRVNVTPVPFDGKAKANLPQPLSLVATPAEFDTDFETALSTWQAPKRSLVEQAQAATGGSSAAAPALPAPKAGSRSSKPTSKGAAKGKTGADQEAAGQVVAGEAAAEDERPGRPAGAGEAEPGDNPGPAPIVDAVDANVNANADADADAGTGEAGEAAPVAAPVAHEPTAADLTLDLF